LEAPITENLFGAGGTKLFTGDVNFSG